MAHRFTICGVHPGLDSAEAGQRLSREGGRFAGFEEGAATYRLGSGKVFVHLDARGRVVTVAGPRLERDGSPLGSAGRAAEDLLGGLGPPESRTPLVRDQVTRELEWNAPDLARSLEAMVDESGVEFWAWEGGRVSARVESGRVKVFVLEGGPH